VRYLIKTQVYFFTEKQGGRNTPFGAGFNPKIKFDGSFDELFTELILEEDDVLFPGDNVKLELTVKGAADYHCYRGASFEFIEGERKIGEGSVSFVELLD
jgi:translation elongation factor EF-Tu-like GTPase